jgi:hypothetical protein
MLSYRNKNVVCDKRSLKLYKSYSLAVYLIPDRASLDNRQQSGRGILDEHPVAWRFSSRGTLRHWQSFDSFAERENLVGLSGEQLQLRCFEVEQSGIESRPVTRFCYELGIAADARKRHR